MSVPSHNGQRQADEPVETTTQIPERLLQQADAAAFAAAAGREYVTPPTEPFPPLEDVPPPPYNEGQYGQLDITQNGINTGARVASDGRVDIKVDEINSRLSTLLVRQLTNYHGQPPNEPPIPEGLGHVGGLPCPPLNIVIQVVGSRGDVQPFIALGQVLKNKFNHRVRLATHPVFRDFVTENGLEFFSIGGDPAELMAFMVKNPGLMPGIEALKSGDIGKRRRGIYEIAHGCWRSCIEPGDGTGPSASDDVLEGRSIANAVSLGDGTAEPFVAEAIIANPPSFAHVHIAEKLGIPLHLMFTMPWSPTQTYPHPLANIVSTNTDAGMTNFLSYIMVDLLTWQGIGDVINRFREKVLRLEPISIIWAPGSLHRLRIPWTYCWSPALIPMPSDWRNFIDIAGFFFLDLASNYTPNSDLAEFLAAGPPPVYIGFGSIVVEDPNAMTKLIFEAMKITGQRALVSKGWGGLAADELGQPEGVFMLGNCPHDWLFEKVSAVVHHGGAGTTAAGIRAGRPTVVVPFFGDQQFWGNMVNKAGAGPRPIHHKELTAEKLAAAILEALKPESLQKAKELSEKIKNEDGPSTGADTFHKRLNIDQMRCSLCPGRVAVWVVKRTNVKLSSLAATVLANASLIEFSELRLFRSREYQVDIGPTDPISGGAAALVGTIGSITAGVADFPSEVLRGFKNATALNEASKRRSRSDTASSGMSGTQTPADASGPSTPVTKEDQDPLSIVVPQAMKVSHAPSSSDETERGRSSGSTPRSMSMVLSPDGASKLCDRCGRPYRGRARSLTPNGHHRCASQDAMRITSESAINSAKAAANIVGVGLKSPLDFTMSLAKGFHNIPRLYNDRTVRETEKVTGFQSGLKVASKNFAYGFMDGIGGVVTQPLIGLKEEGGAGFVKGLVKGSLGLVVKPGAAIWGLPAYTMQGIYAEITKNFGKSTTNYIIAARMAQGYKEFKESGESERERILATWRSGDSANASRRKKMAKSQATTADTSQPDSKKQSKLQKNVVSTQGTDRLVDANGQLISGFRNTIGLSFDERKELARRKEELRRQQSASQEINAASGSAAPPPTDPEFEDAIRTAVQETSTNDPDEDRAIEAAIRASVRELQRARSHGQGQATSGDYAEDDEAYQRAVEASVVEYKRSQQAQVKQESGLIDTGDEKPAGHDVDDEELARVLTESLQEYSARRAASGDHPAEQDIDYEDLRRALAESIETHSIASQLGPSQGTNPGLDLPRRQDQPHSHDEDDAELIEALQKSTRETEELSRQATEEEIVLEYVKKQSLLEEELRRRRAGAS